MANKQQMLDLLHSQPLGNAVWQIVNARSEKEFCGIDAQNNLRAGNILGAIHLEWSDLIDPQTHRFKSPDDVRAVFEKAGIDLCQLGCRHHCRRQTVRRTCV
ncbi:MAG: hypothetical protein ACYC3X_22475 [Pirellulaceae bacterium]